MHPVQSSALWSEGPKFPELWSVSIRRRSMLAKKLKINAMYLRFNSPFSKVSLRTGMTWRKFGTILCIMSLECPLKSTQLSWQNQTQTLVKTAKNWHKSCLKSFQFLDYICRCKQSARYMLQDAQQVVYLIQVMELHTLCQSMRALQFLTLLISLNLLEVILLPICKHFSENAISISTQLKRWIPLET